MPIDDLEQQLAEARARVERALAALVPKHRGGEMEEFRAATAEQLRLERALSSARGEPTCTRIDWKPAWDTGAPTPHVIACDHRTFLVYLTKPTYRIRDGRPVRIIDPAFEGNEALALVEMTRCYAHRFGGPNDEVFEGHPLYGKGLEPYGAHLVTNSPWLAAQRLTNSVHRRFRPERWERLKHFLLLFHDGTFECLAEGYTTEVIEGTFDQVVGLAVARMFGRDDA